MFAKYSKFLALGLALSLLLVACQSTTTGGFFSAYRPVNGNLWNQIANDFKLKHRTDVPSVQAQIRWFQQHPQYLKHISAQAAPYLYYVYSEVHKRHLPAELALIPVIESAYNPHLYSSAGAAGLWQIMPQTGSNYGLKQDWWYDGRRDVPRSTDAALNYLTFLHGFFAGNWLYSIAAYDAGEGTIQNAVRKNMREHKPTDFWMLRIPHETQIYVPRLLALAEIISNPQKYGIELPTVSTRAYLVKVDLDSQIEIKQAAQLAGMKASELANLNPGHQRWATSPNGPYHLLLPIDKAVKFKAKLASLPQKTRVSWQHYSVKAGDSISKIAAYYHTKVAALKEVNQLKSNTIRIGQELIIPKGTLAKTLPHLAHKSLSQKTAKKAAPKSHQVIKKSSSSKNETLYIVQKGDSLERIARRTNTTVAKLKASNHLLNDMIHIGDELKLG